MKEYEIGTMVRLGVGPYGNFGTSSLISKHGWLWVVEEVRGTDMYLCKSIATGAPHNIFLEEMIDATQDHNVG